MSLELPDQIRSDQSSVLEIDSAPLILKRTARPVARGRLSVTPAQQLPITELVVGKPVEEVVELVPRLFSLCRAAQSTAVRHALDLALSEDAALDLRREVLREHMAKLCLHWPVRLCQPVRPLPQGWQDGAGVAYALFGPAETPPETAADTEAFLQSNLGAAPLLLGIARCFEDGIATTPSLDAVTPERAFEPVACENSVAGRQAHRVSLQHIEATRGRGPLWRAFARLWDVADALSHKLPEPVSHAPGRALVCAARGTYAVSAEVRDGVVTAFSRVTPTDHLMAKDGILSHALSTLPADREGLAPLLLDILDPCTPLRLKEGVGNA